jgi:hypothetical protein
MRREWPTRRIYWAAILNGLVAAPLMCVIIYGVQSEGDGEVCDTSLPQMGRVGCHGRHSLCMHRSLKAR